jgi:hypothetical protein
MYSISMLLCDTRPKSESAGAMEAGRIVIREIRDAFPSQHQLFIEIFVSRTPPLQDLEVLTEVVTPDDEVFDASRKVIPLHGVWDFATASVDLGRVHFPRAGAYRFNLYVRESGQSDWPLDPYCFWMLYAVPTRQWQKDNLSR